MNTFGKALKTLIEQRNTDREELAKFVGISKAAISQYTTSEQEPKGSIVVKFANYYKVGIDYFYPDYRIKESGGDFTKILSGAVEKYNERLEKENDHLIFNNQHLWGQNDKFLNMIEQFIAKSL